MERKVLIMAIQQTKKQSDLEKRLSLLRQQVHGKQQYSAPKAESSVTPNTLTPSSDVSYLYEDISKIGILSGIALGFQVILFFLIKSHVLNLKFF